MSTWGLGMSSSIDPETVTDVRCGWQFCTMRVPQRFRSAGMYLCRDHGLLAWSIINEQIQQGESMERTEEEQHEFEQRRSAHPQYGNGQPELLGQSPFDVFVTSDKYEPPGHVYYIRTGQRIKIGYSTDIVRRLSQYPPDMEILYIRRGDKQLERSEHKRFSTHLADGREWFADRPEVVDLIRAMANSDRGWRRIIEDDEDLIRRKRRTAPEVTVRRIA